VKLSYSEIRVGEEDIFIEAVSISGSGLEGLKKIPERGDLFIFHYIKKRGIVSSSTDKFG